MLRKKIAAFFVATALCVGALGTNVFALNYVQNWTSDLGNGPANPGGARRTGPDGWVELTTSLTPSPGRFSVSWATTRSGSGFNNLQGIGWNPGTTNRVVNYNLGVFNHTSGSTGCTYGTFYGWTRNPLIEYYVVDNWVNYGNTTGTQHGTLTSDGGTYRIITENMNGANIDGNGPFKKVKSVRSSTRAIAQNNTITFGNHTSAWANAGHPLGSSMNYQAYIVEGYNSSGNANASVW